MSGYPGKPSGPKWFSWWLVVHSGWMTRLCVANIQSGWMIRLHVSGVAILTSILIGFILLRSPVTLISPLSPHRLTLISPISPGSLPRTAVLSSHISALESSLHRVEGAIPLILISDPSRGLPPCYKFANAHKILIDWRHPEVGI